MAHDPFPHLPDSSRLWVFGVSRPLLEPEETRLLDAVDRFLEGWRAHGHPLAAARHWLHGRFLMVGVDESVTPPSGCSIDALVRVLRELESELGAEIVGGASIWYRDPLARGEPRRVPRPEFRDLVAGGVVDGNTTVFDLALTRVGELRQGRWERRAKDGWHERYLA